MPYERKTDDLVISEELKNILIEIESESQVAKLLLRKRHSKDELVENHVNFISISEQDKTKISYLTRDRISKMEVNPEIDFWISNQRYHAKPGSFIKKLFNDIDPKEVEKFSNLYRSVVKGLNLNFSVVEGYDVSNYYHFKNHAEDRGSMGNSCMKHKHCQGFFGIYTDNPDVIKMLVLLDHNNMLIGRALLWTIGSYKIMDRIYTMCDEEYSFYFKKWASKNGYLYKTNQNFTHTNQFESLNNESQFLQLRVKLKKYDYQTYPYLDTFKWINTSTGDIYNYKPEDGKHIKTICSADGSSFEYNHLGFDEFDKTWCYNGDLVSLTYLNDMRVSARNCNWSDVNNCYILNKDLKYFDHIRDYVFNEQFNTLNNMESIESAMKNRNSSYTPDDIKKVIDEYFGLSRKIRSNNLQETINCSNTIFNSSNTERMYEEAEPTMETESIMEVDDEEEINDPLQSTGRSVTEISIEDNVAISPYSNRLLDAIIPRRANDWSRIISALDGE